MQFLPLHGQTSALCKCHIEQLIAECLNTVENFIQTPQVNKLIIMLYILLLDHSWYLNLYNGLSFFPSLHQYMQEWHPVRERSWCYYSMKIEQTAESLVMTIPRAGRYSEGPYRCVSNADNVTAPDNSSQELAIKVHCECLGWWVGGVRGLSVEQRVGDTIFLFCQIKKP